MKRLQKAKRHPVKVAILGIGHELRGDDAAGLVVAQQLQQFSHEQLLVVEAAHAPENHTGRLRRFRPDLVLMVDCAQLDEPPGATRWLRWQDTGGLSGTTHTMPPYMLARYLTAELDCEVALIGVQPANSYLGAELSPAAREAVDHIVQHITLVLADKTSR